MKERQIGTTLNVGKGDHGRGSHTAPVTVLVYGDYECPYTRELEVSVARLRHFDKEEVPAGTTVTGNAMFTRP